MSQAPETITVFIGGWEEHALTTRGGGVLARLPEAVDVPLDTLREGLSAFLAGVDLIISDSPVKVGAYDLETIEISAQVDGTGRIGFLGTGVELTAAASIRLLLKRSVSHA